MHPATLLAQLDHYADPATGAFVPPIGLGVTTRPADGASDVGSRYRRSGDGAVLLLERVMAGLEGGASAAAFASASAAAHAVFASLRPGDHVLFDHGIYYEFARGLERFGERWGVLVERVDLADPAALGAALRTGRTRLVWAECPTNPLWRVPDLPALAPLVRAAGARLLVDATVATPLLLRPLQHGADLVLHSATKFLNGHGDVLAGVLVAAADDPWWRALLEQRTDAGAVLPPFDAWLLLRGMRTLALRMDRVSRTAACVAEALLAHPAVTAVHYPGLAGDEWHGVAARLFEGGYGGMISFQLRDAAAAQAAVDRFRVFRRATSLGGCESLAEHRLTTEGPGSTCPPGLIRLAIGLEAPADLLDDLRHALLAPGSPP